MEPGPLAPPEVPALGVWRVASLLPDIAARPPAPPLTPGAISFADLWFLGTGIASALLREVPHFDSAPAAAWQVGFDAERDLDVLADRSACAPRGPTPMWTSFPIAAGPRWRR